MLYQNYNGRQPVRIELRGISFPRKRRLVTVKVVTETGTKKSEETVEDVDVGDCVDEMGGLYLRKLTLLLKQDFNFSL